MMSAAGTGVFVLGMHRSGTSAATRAINLLGVPTAAEDELKPPSPNNPTGFWEVPRLTDFNNRLLATLGGSSLAPPLLEPGWAASPELERSRRRATRLFRKAHRTENWVWKDPRNCILFPFWRETLGVRPVVVLSHREPIGVARSMETRQGLSRAMAFAVWERYMREAMNAVEGLPVFVAGYAELVQDPEGWAHRVGAFLREAGLDCDPATGASRVAELVAQSDGASRRGSAAAGDGPGPGRAAENAGTTPMEPSAVQRQLVTAIESLAGLHPAFAAPDLPPETDWVEPLLAERRAAHVQRQQMDERLRSLRKRMRAARAAHAEADQRLEEVMRSRRSPLRAAAGRLSKRARSSDGQSRGALPDFLIIGGQKCGTSSLFRYLGLSEHVALPDKKEIHYFDLQHERGIDWYMRQFPATATSRGSRRGRRLTGEASPYYMFHPLTPQRVREALPDVRLLALLRNPTHRAVSHYYHEVGNGFETLPLGAALAQEDDRLAGESERLASEPGYVSFNHRHFSYQARGVYADQLDAWRAVFPADQLLVINSQGLFTDPRREMARAWEFLELPGQPPSHYSTYNERAYPSVPGDVERGLRERFAKDNARLYRAVGEDYGWESSEPA